MNWKGAAIFLLLSTMFPPSELKQKVAAIFYREVDDIHRFIESILKNLIDKGVARNISLEEHVSIFYKLVDSFIFEITALDKCITEEELNKHWQCYWQWIKV